MILPVNKIGDTILEMRCQSIVFEKLEKLVIPRGQHLFATRCANTLEAFIKNMIETAIAHDAVGLAANQVGESLSIFIFKKRPEMRLHNHATDFEVAINPSIIVGHEKMFYDWEGCLSVPKIEAEVPRYPNITLFYSDINGERKRLETSGMAARVIQHEIEHLQGKLFLETANKIRYVK